MGTGEPGYGREGGRHGLGAYLDTGWHASALTAPSAALEGGIGQVSAPKKGATEYLDLALAVPKTYKLYYRGRLPTQRIGPHL